MSKSNVIPLFTADPTDENGQHLPQKELELEVPQSKEMLPENQSRDRGLFDNELGHILDL